MNAQVPRKVQTHDSLIRIRRVSTFAVVTFQICANP